LISDRSATAKYFIGRRLKMDRYRQIYYYITPETANNVGYRWHMVFYISYSFRKVKLYMFNSTLIYEVRQ